MRAVPCGDPARAVGLRTAHHDSVQGGLALAVVALSALAAARPPARRFTGAVVGVAAAYLGLVCLARPDVVGGVGPAWSWLSTAWGLAFAVAAALAPGEVRAGGAGTHALAEREVVATLVSGRAVQRVSSG